MDPAGPEVPTDDVGRIVRLVDRAANPVAAARVWSRSTARAVRARPPWRPTSPRPWRAPVIHMDDLYPGWDGLARRRPQRVESWIVAPLLSGEPARYRRWDWEAERVRRVARGRRRPRSSSSRAAGPAPFPPATFLSVLVWVDADADRAARPSARPGPRLRRRSGTAGPPRRRRCTQADRTRARADLFLDTSTGADPAILGACPPPRQTSGTADASESERLARVRAMFGRGVARTRPPTSQDLARAAARSRREAQGPHGPAMVSRLFFIVQCGARRRDRVVGGHRGVLAPHPAVLRAGHRDHLARDVVRPAAAPGHRGHDRRRRRGLRRRRVRALLRLGRLADRRGRGAGDERRGAARRRACCSPRQAGVQSVIVTTLVAAPGQAFTRWLDAVVGGLVALVFTLVAPAAPLRRPAPTGRAGRRGDRRDPHRHRPVPARARLRPRLGHAVPRARDSESHARRAAGAVRGGHRRRPVLAVAAPPPARRCRPSPTSSSPSTAPSATCASSSAGRPSRPGARSRCRPATCGCWTRWPRPPRTSPRELAGAPPADATRAVGLHRIAEASAVLDPSSGLSGEVMRAQIRSMVVDLLMLTGLPHEEAREHGAGVDDAPRRRRAEPPAGRLGVDVRATHPPPSRLAAGPRARGRGGQPPHRDRQRPPADASPSPPTSASRTPPSVP